MSRTPTPPLGYTILVTDQLPVLREFYVDIIGLEVVEERSGYVKFDVGSLFLAIREANRRYDSTGSGRSVQLAFAVPLSDVDDWAQRLAESGVEILEKPTDQPWGHRTLFAADPDGNLIEFYAELTG